jgi:hypothetical protein
MPYLQTMRSVLTEHVHVLIYSGHTRRLCTSLNYTVTDNAISKGRTQLHILYLYYVNNSSPDPSALALFL